MSWMCTCATCAISWDATPTSSKRCAARATSSGRTGTTARRPTMGSAAAKRLTECLRLRERLRPPQQTFRARLTLGATLLCLGALAVAGGVIFLGVRQTLLWHLDSALLSIARTELASALNRSLDRTSIY